MRREFIVAFIFFCSELLVRVDTTSGKFLRRCLTDGWLKNDSAESGRLSSAFLRWQLPVWHTGHSPAFGNLIMWTAGTELDGHLGQAD